MSLPDTAFDRVAAHLNQHGPDVPYAGNKQDLIDVQNHLKRVSENGVELSPYMISLLRLGDLL